jgi:NAD(P)-dependent dehydrogenase (short-subunit alcohol dehydrogenase family)
MAEQGPLAIVAGAGPGLGRALVDRFTEGGYTAIGLRRTASDGDGGSPIRQVDLTDAEATARVVGALIAEHGAPKVVIHNPSYRVRGPFMDIDPGDFEASWRATVLSAVTLARATVDPMVQAGGGAFLFSGATASLRGGPQSSAFASSKFALRGLAQSLAREYHAAGLHVAHVVLDGIIDTPRNQERGIIPAEKMMRRADLADAYWHLAHQPASAWSNEVDLRPMPETF